ncbi:PREDICTED: doublecortin domain-containing protein 2-like [Crocodylus porosus]|uniref:doublecortin domain-containing protein 2-like n=1 Tax=Crocodylus porosus TaxID=8502 RepID=UPI00093A4619|nr:PREDICTED: doublecortin domain-containing protein 2-like [Crocodylus porosus]
MSSIAEAPSIFKADESRTEVQGAAEVQEDNNMKTEMPIDQVPAEVVQEEEIETPVNTSVDEEAMDGNVDTAPSAASLKLDH